MTDNSVTQQESIITPRLLAKLRAITDSKGRPIWSPGMCLDGPDDIMGEPVRVQ